MEALKQFITHTQRYHYTYLRVGNFRFLIQICPIVYIVGPTFVKAFHQLYCQRNQHLFKTVVKLNIISFVCFFPQKEIYFSSDRIHCLFSSISFSFSLWQHLVGIINNSISLILFIIELMGYLTLYLGAGGTRCVLLASSINN